MLTARDGDVCGEGVFSSRGDRLSVRRAQDRIQEVRRRRAEVKEARGRCRGKRDPG
jgi:hypothetical protein